MQKAALYVRVSTSMQIDKDSLPFQRKELINYAKYVLGIDNFEIFEDAGYSAKNTDRPKYQEMMARIRNREFTHLLVWKIDRISRNLKDFTEMYEEIKSYNITFISKNEQFDTSTAMGEAMLKIILVFAELERKLTGERVFSIMLSRAEKGLWNGATVPLGYKWSDEEKFPVIDENEAETVRYIYDLYENLQSSPKVAFQLNSEQVKTKRDGKWTAKTVGDILRNPFYIGTYRYNTKTSGTRRWKDESEWVVVEDNHPGIITKEQFEKVQKIRDANYSGNGQVQRSNVNTHIFSKMLFCEKCGSTLNAGLDVARKDGYRPSRYTCYSKHYLDNIDGCNNFVSDIILLPFVLNYIANFVNLHKKVTANHSLRDIERRLLRGNAFVDVIGVDKKGLEETYLAFTVGFRQQAYDKKVKEEKSLINLEAESLKKEKVKYEKALQRLEDLYLFSEEAMSEKDFLFKKRDIIQHIEQVNSKLAAVNEKNSTMSTGTDFTFIKNANYFLLRQQIEDKRHIDYRQLLEVVDKELIRELVSSVIQKIVVADKKIYSITFQNGITHKFVYKPLEERKNRPKEKFLYRSFEPMLLDYLKENNSFTRNEIQELTGLSRSGVTSIVNEFIDREIIIRKGNSVATKYFLNEKKTT